MEQYKKIGTVEECREAVERQKLKKSKEIWKMSKIELKPCPFCKTMPYTSIESADGEKIKGYIQCNEPDCGAKIDFKYKSKNGFLTFDEVMEALSEIIEAWNRRAGEQNE